MPDILNSAYWIGREKAQRDMNDAAIDPKVKAIHRQLADRHADRAWSEEAVEKPEHESDVAGRRASA